MWKHCRQVYLCRMRSKNSNVNDNANGNDEVLRRQQVAKAPTDVVTYTQHGLPSYRDDTLSRKQLENEQRLHDLRLASEQFQVAECTFRPQIYSNKTIVEVSIYISIYIYIYITYIEVF